MTDVNLGPRNAPSSAIGVCTFAILLIMGLVVRYVWQIRLRRRDGR